MRGMSSTMILSLTVKLSPLSRKTIYLCRNSSTTVLRRRKKNKIMLETLFLLAFSKILEPTTLISVRTSSLSLNWMSI